MRTEIIAVGDELTSGQRLDTNSQWLSLRLGELGLPVIAHTTVSDDLQLGIAAIRVAAQRADLVVMTGGLGPTADDLTRQCLAAAAGVELVLDEPSLRHIQQLFARRSRPMPESNRLQAEFPAGSRIIPNPHGSAPGIDLDLVSDSGKQCRIFALPGVPAEMREMWAQTVAPELQRQLPGGPRLIVHRQIKCFGVGESDLEQMLPDLIRRGREPSVGITVHRATITLRITARGTSLDDCQAQIEPVEATIRACLGGLVFGVDDQELQDVVIAELRRRHLTLATAECGTAGKIASWLAQADPDHATYLGGLVLPQPERLTTWFPSDATGSAPASLQGLPSTREGVAEWAAMTRIRTQADVAIAIGPFPAPNASTPYYFALADRETTQTGSGQFVGHPEILVDRAAKQVLNLLRHSLTTR